MERILRFFHLLSR